MSVKDKLMKAAGLFFTFEPADPAADAPVVRPKTVEQILRESPGPNLDEIRVPASPVANEPSSPVEPVLGGDGKVNFDSIYKMANLPDTPFTAEQVLEVFASLPAELPIETKRATVKVTLTAMAKTTGASIESVVADSSRKLAALAAFAESFGGQADKYVQLAEAEIANLEAQIATKKSSINDAKAKKQIVGDACDAESERLDDVLEFFSNDTSPSKHA